MRVNPSCQYCPSLICIDRSLNSLSPKTLEIMNECLFWSLVYTKHIHLYQRAFAWYWPRLQWGLWLRSPVEGLQLCIKVLPIDCDYLYYSPLDCSEAIKYASGLVFLAFLKSLKRPRGSMSMSMSENALRPFQKISSSHLGGRLSRLIINARGSHNYVLRYCDVLVYVAESLRWLSGQRRNWHQLLWILL